VGKRDDGFGIRATISNHVEGGDIRGNLGQFGHVHGDVNMSWTEEQDPAVLARAVEEGLRQAERTRKLAEQEQRERELKEGAELALILTGATFVALLAFGVELGTAILASPMLYLLWWGFVTGDAQRKR
jgi:hypothetical protein